MDFYGWYTLYTSTRELHTQWCNRVQQADPHRPPQPARRADPPPRRRLRLTVGRVLIATGTRLVTAHRGIGSHARASTAPSTPAPLATRLTREPTARD